MLKIVKAKTLYESTAKYYRINQLDNIQQGEYFVGETCFGEDIVQIVCPKISEMSIEQWDESLKGKKNTKRSHFSFEPQLLRRATESEVEDSHNNIVNASTYKDIFEQKIKEYNINLNIVNLHYALSRDRLICIYTAPGRVDFRELVRDLGHVLKQRIELFQIQNTPTPSVTIQTEKHSIGVCGRDACCRFCNYADISHHLESTPKTMKNLGCCNKVKCCMAFEKDRFLKDNLSQRVEKS